MNKEFNVVIPEQASDIYDKLVSVIPGNYYTALIKRLQVTEVIYAARHATSDNPVTDYSLSKLTSQGKVSRDYGMHLGEMLGLFEEITYRGKKAWRKL
jgi:hypothetical protein